MDNCHSETHTPSSGCDLLRDSRRQYVLYRLMQHKYGTIDDLSGQIARWEAETAGDSVSEREQQRIAISLVHNHLPRLADHGIIEYDQRSGDIVLVATNRELDSLIEPIQRFETASEA